MSSFSIKDKLGKSHKSLSCFDGSTPKTVEEWLDNLELANYKSLFKKYKCVEVRPHNLTYLKLNIVTFFQRTKIKCFTI